LPSNFSLCRPSFAKASEGILLRDQAGFDPAKRLDPAWPEIMRRIEKETGCIFPVWTKTASYEACRCAGYFENRTPVKKETMAGPPVAVAPRLVAIAG
jgi:hypothetical protein